MKRIKLNSLADNSLKNRQMNCLTGGYQTNGAIQADCPNGCCGCMYQYQGGSSNVDNMNANVAKGLYSPNCERGSSCYADAGESMD